MSATRSFPVSDEILAFLEAEAGLVFPQGRLADVERSLAKVAARAGVRDCDRLLAHLRENASCFEELLDGLVVGETYFFREPQQFECLREIVLPELLRSRPHDGRLSIWSAGCATGEEAYSLAILLEQEGLSSRSDILATDVSVAALQKAKRAGYEHWSFRGMKKDLLQNYFRARGGRYHLAERIRDRVAFERANLAAEQYPQPSNAERFDLIFCRNVMIYFGPQTVAAVARRLFDRLKDGGWLVTAPSDPPLWDLAPFETCMTAGGVFYRKRPPAKEKPSNVIPFPHKAVETVPKSKPRLHAVKTADDEFRHSAQACERHALSLFAHNRAKAALEFLARAVVWHPLSRELHYIYAVGFLNGEMPQKAAEIARRLVYLDRRSVAAHMLLGTIAQRCGDYTGAMRAYRNGLSFCAAAGEDDIVPLTGNERYGRVAAALAAEIAALQSAEGAS
jgi:chemotaxis protein methyltransferase CheR